MTSEILLKRLDKTDLKSIKPVLDTLVLPSWIYSAGRSIDEIDFVCSAINEMISTYREVSKNNVVWVSFNNGHQDAHLARELKRDETTPRMEFARIYRYSDADLLIGREAELVTPIYSQRILGVYPFSENRVDMDGFAWMTEEHEDEDRQSGFITPIGVIPTVGCRQNMQLD